MLGIALNHQKLTLSTDLQQLLPDSARAKVADYSEELAYRTTPWRHLSAAQLFNGTQAQFDTVDTSVDSDFGIIVASRQQVIAQESAMEKTLTIGVDTDRHVCRLVQPAGDSHRHYSYSCR